MNESNKEVTYHRFYASQFASDKCAICKVYQKDHNCEVCGKSTMTIEEVMTDEVTIEKEVAVELCISTGNILMCRSCKVAEDTLTSNNNTIEKQDERVDLHNNLHAIALNATRAIDNSITVRTDLFNAATVSIIDLKNMIDKDNTITNKPFALASELKTRFEHFQNVIFASQDTIVEASNNQRAIQVYLNELANKLRAEEREKLKIADISYKPKLVETVKVKSIKSTAKKIDKDEVKKLAKELGVGEFTIMAFVTAKGCSVAEAGNMIRRSMNEAKSM